MLIEAESRPADMVCEMEIRKGEMTDLQFYEAVIHSHAAHDLQRSVRYRRTCREDAQKSYTATLRKRHESPH